jgi:hypothetical protein
MKSILYYDIIAGALPLLVANIIPEIVTHENKWEKAVGFNGTASVICIPTWNWEFESLLDLEKFLYSKMNRDGYYTITGRRCDQDRLYKSPDGKSEVYFSCFGIAYSPEPWIKNTHHWTGLEQNSKLPSWLMALNPLLYSISHIKS